MGMKASEVSNWLRQIAGKRDHHELMPEDYVVLRPGPNFHWLMGQGSPARTDPLPPAWCRDRLAGAEELSGVGERPLSPCPAPGSRSCPSSSTRTAAIIFRDSRSSSPRPGLP